VLTVLVEAVTPDTVCLMHQRIECQAPENWLG
jgi:hypothetical protein